MGNVNVYGVMWWITVAIAKLSIEFGYDAICVYRFVNWNCDVFAFELLFTADLVT